MAEAGEQLAAFLATPEKLASREKVSAKVASSRRSLAGSVPNMP